MLKQLPEQQKKNFICVIYWCDLNFRATTDFTFVCCHLFTIVQVQELWLIKKVMKIFFVYFLKKKQEGFSLKKYRLLLLRGFHSSI